MLVLGRHWWLVFCTPSHPPWNSLCQNFTCVFDSVDSPYCARNLRQISLGPTFSLVRNFITTHCATVIGTSLSPILNSTIWGEGRVVSARLRGSPLPTTPPHKVSNTIVLIRWLQLTEVGLYLIYLIQYSRVSFCDGSFMTFHFYNPSPVEPSPPDLWCITVATQASFLHLVRFSLFSDEHVFLIFLF